MRAPSSAALALIKHFEQGPGGDFAAQPYRCPAGHVTIGWGHVVRPGESLATPLTAAQANALLESDLARIAPGIEAYVGQLPVTPSMFDALCCLAFNIGVGALLGSTLMACVRKQDWTAAADEFLRWDKARDPKTGRKVPLAGLTRRRQSERELFLRDGVPG